MVPSDLPDRATAAVRQHSFTGGPDLNKETVQCNVSDAAEAKISEHLGSDTKNK